MIFLRFFFFFLFFPFHCLSSLVPWLYSCILFILSYFSLSLFARSATRPWNACWNDWPTSVSSASTFSTPSCWPTASSPAGCTCSRRLCGSTRPRRRSRSRTLGMAGAFGMAFFPSRVRAGLGEESEPFLLIRNMRSRFLARAFSRVGLMYRVRKKQKKGSIFWI